MDIFAVLVYTVRNGWSPSSRRSMSPDQNIRLTMVLCSSLVTVRDAVVDAPGFLARSSREAWRMFHSSFFGHTGANSVTEAQ